MGEDLQSASRDSFPELETGDRAVIPATKAISCHVLVSRPISNISLLKCPQPPCAAKPGLHGALTRPAPGYGAAQPDSLIARVFRSVFPALCISSPGRCPPKQHIPARATLPGHPWLPDGRAGRPQAPGYPAGRQGESDVALRGPAPAARPRPAPAAAERRESAPTWVSVGRTGGWRKGGSEPLSGRDSRVRKGASCPRKKFPKKEIQFSTFPKGWDCNSPPSPTPFLFFLTTPSSKHSKQREVISCGRASGAIPGAQPGKGGCLGEQSPGEQRGHRQLCQRQQCLLQCLYAWV